MPAVLVVDNYDSFTFNLVHCLELSGARCEVVANDAADIAAVRGRAPAGIVVSAGPCTPREAGVSLSIVEELAAEIPILGVCLGHQVIGQVFGGRVVRADRVVHGKTSPIAHDGRGVFFGLPSPFVATRYHSLVVERSTLPATLVVTAWTAEGEIMGLRHREHRVEGVQFHPESILTEAGSALIDNWVRSLRDDGRAARPAVANG